MPPQSYPAPCGALFLPSYRHLPADSRRRGLPHIGFSFEIPRGVELCPIATGPCIVRGEQRDAGGRVIGELELRVFGAALVLERDAILERTAERAVADAAAGIDGEPRRAAPVPVRFPSCDGYRAEIDLVAVGAPRPPLPYLAALALAPLDLGVCGGLLVVSRAAAPEWDALATLLESLSLVTRAGALAAGATPSEDLDAPPRLPMVSRRR